MLSWSSRFNICVFLDNQHYEPPFHGFDNLLAAGVVDSVRASAGQALEELRGFLSRHQDWLFGQFAYDLAKETEPFGGPNGGECIVMSPVGDTAGLDAIRAALDASLAVQRASGPDTETVWVTPRHRVTAARMGNAQAQGMRIRVAALERQ